MKGLLTAALAAVVLLGTGCASVTQGTTHALRIETQIERGEQVDGAECSLTNDQGTTLARSGGSALVRRSSKDLEITCATRGQPDARGRLVSRANAGLAGNILIGGAIGAVIDHNTGAAYTYPTWIRMVFGQFNVYDRRDEHEGAALAPAVAALSQSAQAPDPAPAPAPAPELAAAPARKESPPAVPLGAAVVRGDTFDYRVTDRLTGRQQTVVLRAERVNGGEVSFNGGSRVESANGSVRINTAMAGEMDSVTPPGGWLPGGKTPSGVWKMRYPSIVPGSTMRYDLEASLQGEQDVVVDGRNLRTVRIGLQGWAENRTSLLTTRARYEATAWVSPELGRAVRYEVRSRSSGSHGVANFAIDEVVELVRFGRD